MTTAVVPIPLGVSTAYAIRGASTVLVDTGFAGGEDRLLNRMTRAGIDPGSISLIVLTHCHPDHAGGARALQRRLRVPVAVHEAEVAWAESGSSDLYTPLHPFGRLLRRFLDTDFPAITPDVTLTDGTGLDAHGVPVEVLHTPGHTPGSITLRHRESGEVVVGDLLTGSMTRRDRPGLPFLAQDIALLRVGAHRVLATGPSRFLFGHGRPASAASVRRFLGSD